MQHTVRCKCTHSARSWPDCTLRELPSVQTVFDWNVFLRSKWATIASIKLNGSKLLFHYFRTNPHDEKIRKCQINRWFRGIDQKHPFCTIIWKFAHGKKIKFRIWCSDSRGMSLIRLTTRKANELEKNCLPTCVCLNRKKVGSFKRLRLRDIFDESLNSS